MGTRRGVRCIADPIGQEVRRIRIGQRPLTALIPLSRLAELVHPGPDSPASLDLGFRSRANRTRSNNIAGAHCTAPHRSCARSSRPPVSGERSENRMLVCNSATTAASGNGIRPTGRCADDGTKSAEQHEERTLTVATITGTALAMTCEPPHSSFLVTTGPAYFAERHPGVRHISTVTSIADFLTSRRTQTGKTEIVQAPVQPIRHSSVPAGSGKPVPPGARATSPTKSVSSSWI